MKPVKKSKGAEAIFLILIGILLTIVFLVVSLVSKEFGILAVLVVMPLTIVPIEAGLYKRKILYMLKESTHDKTLSSQVGKTLKWVNLFQSIIVYGVITLAVISIIGVILWFATDISINPGTYAMIFMYVGYMILRKYLISFFKKILRIKEIEVEPGKAPLRTSDLGVKPKFQLKKDSVDIDLDIKKLGDKNKKYIVNIKFDEIEEIKVLKQIEVDPFLRYSIGPKMAFLKIKQAKEIANYLRGKIPKPGVQIVKTDGFNLYMKGPDLFYLIGLKDKNPKEVVDAFNKYKRGNKK